MKIVNTIGVNHAKSLIRKGAVDLDSDWSFTADDGNAILGDDNWAEYEKWFLCIDTEENEQTKARYKYPYGKNGKVYRRGVIAAKQRANQQKDYNIAEVADELLQMIDEKYSEESKAVNNIVKKVFKGEIRSIDDSDFVIEAVVSSEVIDRYNEVILASAWKNGLDNFKKHPILLSSHNYDDLTAQIGEVKDIKIKDGSLVARLKYYVGEGNDQADWGYKLAKKGLSAFSVGFIPRKYTSDEDEIKSLLNIKGDRDKLPYRVYTDVELLEISQVLIPANPNALARDLSSITDPVVRSIYELGKNMFEEKSDSTVEVKTQTNQTEEINNVKIFNELIELKHKIVTMESLIVGLKNVILDLNDNLHSMIDNRRSVVSNIESKDSIESKDLEILVGELKKFTALLK